MNRYPQGWLVGHVEKIPAAGGEHAIIRQRRVETAITVIITRRLHSETTPATQWAIPRRMFSRPTKTKRSEVASSKFERAPRAECLPAPKNFFAKTSFTQRLPPLWAEPFLDRFLSEGARPKSRNEKSPLPGVKRAANDF